MYLRDVTEMLHSVSLPSCGVGVGVSVGAGVSVTCIGLGVGVTVGVGVMVGVGLGLGVAVGLGVFVGCSVGVMVGISVGFASECLNGVRDRMTRQRMITMLTSAMTIKNAVSFFSIFLFNLLHLFNRDLVLARPYDFQPGHILDVL